MQNNCYYFCFILFPLNRLGICFFCLFLCWINHGSRSFRLPEMVIFRNQQRQEMNIAIILAGGSGSRLGGDLPKQFIKVAGKTIIEHTLDVFEHHPQIDEIAVVSRPDFIPTVRQIVSDGGYTKVRQVLPGGKERYDSSLSALRAYTNDDDNLLLHDAVRPLVSHRIISDCISALDTYEAVDVATMTTDTIVQVDDNNCIAAIPPRQYLRNVQTPQCFRRSTIMRAYELALQDPEFVTTDDCGVVKKYLPEVPIFIVKGEPTNIKVTYAEDLFLMERLCMTRDLGQG